MYPKTQRLEALPGLQQWWLLGDHFRTQNWKRMDKKSPKSICDSFLCQRNVQLFVAEHWTTIEPLFQKHAPWLLRIYYSDCLISCFRKPDFRARIFGSQLIKLAVARGIKKMPFEQIRSEVFPNRSLMCWFTHVPFHEASASCILGVRINWTHCALWKPW